MNTEQEEKQEKEFTENQQEAISIEESESIENQQETTLEQETELSKLQQAADEYKDKYIRLFAEFDNFKRRNAKEKLELIKSAGQDVVKTLLPILDDIKRAQATYDKNQNAENFVNGTQLINDKLLKSLQQKGLKKIECLGSEFNLEYHEAIAEIPAPTEADKGKVLDVVEDGYLLNDVIIRYAKVVVGK